MRVLFVSPWFHGAGASGVVTACRNLAVGLSRRNDVTDVVILALSDEGHDPEQGAGFTVAHMRRQQRLALASDGWPDYRAVRAWLRSSGFEPDVVHGQGVAGEGLLAVRVARRLGVPSVVTVHGRLDKEARLYSDSVRAFLARRVMDRALRGATGVVFVSPYGTDELRLRRGARSRVIANAIDDEAFDLSRAKRTQTVLYAGFVGRRKRLQDLVRACSRARRQLPELRLRIAGPVRESDYAAEVHDEIAAQGMGDAVDLLGPLTPAALRVEYQTAGVLALASEEENAPQVIAEAMATGLPVIATAVGGVGWMLSGGGGDLVRVGDIAAMEDRVVTLIGDEAAWTEKSRAARRDAERFRADRVAAETRRLYSDAMARA